MKQLGWCLKVEEAERLAGLGFDYIECPVVSLQLEDDEVSREHIRSYVNSSLPVRAMNLFLPGDLKVVGPQADRERIHRYVYKAGEAAAKIGTEIVVFGSGGARTIPEGWGRDRAEEQILRLLETIAKEWEGNGVTLALEPLNRKETNIVNNIEEAVQFARLMNHPAVRVLADFYHMDEEQEPLEAISANKEWIAHIHVADTGRRAPGTGAYPYKQFINILREAGYQGMISAECILQGTEQELEHSLQFMRSLVDE